MTTVTQSTLGQAVWGQRWLSHVPPAVDWIATAPVVPALLAVGLASVHVVARRFALAGMVPRSRFLSFAGGVSVAYVFVHVLPELRRTRRFLGEGAIPVLTTAEGVYVVTMVGFVVYYGLERLACQSAGEAPDDEPTRRIFWVHVASFAAYNGIIGYLLFNHELPGLESLVLFAVAIGLHLFVVDYGLQDRFADPYATFGRWILAGAVLTGGAVGAIVQIDRGYFGLLFAFVAGGVVLNVIKEELPAESDSSFPAFGLGVAGYTVILLAL